MQSASTQVFAGPRYLLRGLQIISTPGLRRFVFVPLFVNLCLFAVSVFMLISRINGWIEQIVGYVPDWLSWLTWLIWPIALICMLLGFGFSFSIVASWIAAPFNGLLAEKVEQHLRQETLQGATLQELIKDLPRVFYREWQKLCYWLPRAAFIVLFFFIPLIGQSVAPLLWLVFSAWMMCIQYADYPFDNHKVSFLAMRHELERDRMRSFGFGATVVFFNSIPLLNLFVMPIAVAGATAMWVEQSRQRCLSQ